jgi:hypothetical protein
MEHNDQIKIFEDKIEKLSNQEETIQISITLNKHWIQGDSGVIFIVWKSINDLIEKKKIEYDKEIKKLCDEIEAFEKETGIEIF